MKLLITGAKGQLGSAIKEIAKDYTTHQYFYTDIDTLDLLDKEAIQKFCADNKIEAIINCAGYTAVDKAETDRELAYKVNVTACANLAEISREQKIKLIHISTDFIFDGTKSTPYIETDKANPISYYGETKLLGEQKIQAISPSYMIIRTSWMYSIYGNNFVKTMLRLAKEKKELNVIFDQIGTPTFANDLSRVIMEILPIIKEDTQEIYHYSNEGIASWYDFTHAIIEYSGIDCPVHPIETKDYPTPAKRPNCSVMNKTKIKNAFGLSIPHWRDSLRVCIAKMGEMQ